MPPRVTTNWYSSRCATCLFYDLLLTETHCALREFPDHRVSSSSNSRCGDCSFPPDRGATPQWRVARPDRRPPEISPTGPSGGHTADRPWPGEIGSQIGLGFSQVAFLALPTSLEIILNWWDSLVLSAFGAATLAVAGWVSERVYWAGRWPSSSPCDRINCVLDDDSLLGLAVILSPVGEGWSAPCFPEQFLRPTELIKRSLWLDKEPTWWCLQPLQPRTGRIQSSAICEHSY